MRNFRRASIMLSDKFCKAPLLTVTFTVPEYFKVPF
jgi:hypothetical protein